MILSTKPYLALAFAAAALVGIAAAPVAAASSPKTGHHKMPAAHTIYLCKDYKVFFTPSVAKKMGYKDKMGHPLVKASKTPAGYMDASKMKMSQ
ncbi:MAG: hypothetical protein JWQ02_2187 [Capsulimonas sp.]|jgi:hypothetical protein|nr:hypothetical protein [Capsulimonas sp.]